MPPACWGEYRGWSPCPLFVHSDVVVGSDSGFGERLPFADAVIVPGYPFRHELQACLGLLEFAKLRFAAHAFLPAEGVNQVSVVEAVRATNAFGAILCLAAGGFGSQAEMLSRVVYESALVLSWASRHAEEAAERYELNRRLLERLHIEARNAAGIYAHTELPDLSDSDRDKATQLFGRYGEKSWTGLSIRGLSADHRASISDPHCRPPVAWDHLEVCSASVMGPPVRQ